MSNAWNRWLQHATKGESARSVAQRINRSPSTIVRWSRDGVPAEAPLEIALAYRTDLVAGLIAAGLLKRCEVGSVISLQQIPSTALLAELHRRELSRE